MDELVVGDEVAQIVLASVAVISLLISVGSILHSRNQSSKGANRKWREMTDNKTRRNSDDIKMIKGRLSGHDNHLRDIRNEVRDLRKEISSVQGDVKAVDTKIDTLITLTRRNGNHEGR